MPNWDAVYEAKDIASTCAAEVLIDYMDRLPASGIALDYACGLGGNSILLARQGFNVVALDQSSVALTKLDKYAQHNNLSIKTQICDLEENPPAYDAQFDVIVVSYFLHRKTLAELYGYLRKDGILVYQTFSGDQIEGKGPASSDYRLRRGELLKVFDKMQLLYYREDIYRKNCQGPLSGQVQFVARK